MDDGIKGISHAVGLKFSTPPGPDDKVEYIRPSWEPWYDLLAISPELKQLHADYRRQKKPPDPLKDWLFLSLCAAFADPNRRSILRTLILDLIASDLMDYFVSRERDQE